MRTRDGQTLEQSADNVEPTDPDGVHERFFAAASERLGDERARELDALIGTLEACADAASSPASPRMSGAQCNEETTHNGSAPRESVRRVALASMIGTSIEWYDFFIFGTASALVFGRLFFPTFSELAGTLAAFATFAVGFVARPVGGLVFGHFGDRLGRKTMLVVTLTMMGLATFAMGLMPTYDTIGVWAPILMVVLRFVQGLAVGGEWGGAVLMATEHAGGQRRGFFGSFAQVGSAVGGLMSTGMFLLMQQLPEEDFVAWGWRVPFLVSIVLVFVGLFIRLRIMESPVVREDQGKQPRREGAGRRALAHRHAQRAAGRGSLLRARHTVLRDDGLHARLHDGRLRSRAEHVPHRRDGGGRGPAHHDTAARRALGQARPTPRDHLRHAVHHRVRRAAQFHDHVADTRCSCGSRSSSASASATTPCTRRRRPSTTEMFPAHVRYSGASLGYQLGGAIAGFVPLVAASLVGAAGGAYWPIAALIALGGFVGFVCILLVRPAVAAPGPQGTA